MTQIQVAAVSILVVAQYFNLVRRAVRWALSALSLALSLLGARIVGYEADAVAGVWFIGLIFVYAKWQYEVKSDVYWREEKGRPLLVRDWQHVSLFLNPFYVPIYRWRLFRDPKSLHYLLKQSVYVNSPIFSPRPTKRSS